MAYIVVENGALQGQQFQLGDEAFLIGRHSSCDIVLPIPGVSGSTVRSQRRDPATRSRI